MNWEDTDIERKRELVLRSIRRDETRAALIEAARAVAAREPEVDVSDTRDPPFFECAYCGNLAHIGREIPHAATCEWALLRAALVAFDGS